MSYEPLVARAGRALALALLLTSVGCRAACGGDPPGEAEADDPAGETLAASDDAAGETPMDLEARARELAQRIIIADGHVDLPYRLRLGLDEDGRLTEDVTERTERGDFDYPRAREGGLDAPFMSIYVPARFQDEGGAKAEADLLIDLVEGLIASAPDKFAAATSPDEIERNTEAGLISLPMGIENGAALEGELANLQHFYDRGVRYITLTHSKDNDLSDSSYDDDATWGGLSPLGEKVVAEMNRLGILVDISHLSDDAAMQAIELSEVPVIASHSSLRHFLPDFERNMSDEMVRALGQHGGLLMINFGSTFVSQAAHDYFRGLGEARNAAGIAWGTDEARAHAEQYKAENPPVYATVADVADHIDRAVELAGIDHVGLGSDYDGVGDTLPIGLKDASTFPNLFAELLERGYREEDIEKLASGNLFRVWRQAEAHARAQEAAR
jgi:membrane dipeptidase